MFDVYLQMAPEVIRSEQYGTKADVYSFGMMLHGIACGIEYPYENEFLTAVQAAMGVAKEGLRPGIYAGLDENVKTVFQACWAAEPAKRPDMETVVEMLEEVKKKLEQKSKAGNEGWGLSSWIWG